jgi:hypothetical protein
VKTTSFVRVIVAALAFAATAPRAVVPLDVVGIRLGMPVTEAMDRLKSQRPALDIKTLSMRIDELGAGPNVWLISAETGSDRNGGLDGSDRYWIGVTVPPNTPSVWAVWRFVRYGKGKKLARSNVLDALREKYGRETYNLNEQQLFWAWDAQGAPLTAEQARECAAWASLDRVLYVPSEVSRARIVPPAERVCVTARYVSATIDSEVNEQVVGGFSVGIVDSALDIRSMEATRNLIKEQGARATGKEVDRARRQGKPTL